MRIHDPRDKKRMSGMSKTRQGGGLNTPRCCCFLLYQPLPLSLKVDSLGKPIFFPQCLTCILYRENLIGILVLTGVGARA